MSKTLVIGATGILGSRVVEALGEDRCVRAARNSGERVDLSDPKSLGALFARVGELDGIVCAAGAARYKPWDALTDEDWAFSLANKLMGQINLVRFGFEHIADRGSFTLTTGILARSPMVGSAAISLVNAGIEGFVRAAALEAPRGIHIRSSAARAALHHRTLVRSGPG